MKNIIYSIVTFSICFLFSSCEKDFDRKVFPHSTPILENVQITAIDGSNSSVITFGDSIDFSAAITDAATPLSTITFKMISNNNKLLFSDKIIIGGNRDDVKVRYRTPFVSNLDSQTPQILITVVNVEGDSINYYLPNENNVYINRPNIEDALYVVTESNSVIKLTRSDSNENVYSATGLHITEEELRYRIAQKIDSENKIDYSDFVWGDTNDGISIIDEESGLPLSFENGNKTVINSISFNAYTFDVTITREPISINNNELKSGIYAGYLSTTLQLENGQEVSFEGIDDIKALLDPNFFTYVSDTKAIFIGLSGTYTINCNSTTKFLYVEQSSAIYPEALWICGTGLGFPQPSYATTTKWGWDVPSDYIYCGKISEGVFQATLYADNFDLKFYHQRGWGDEEKSNNYTVKPDNLWAANISNGNWIASPFYTFVKGIYKVTIDTNNKTTSLEKLN